jgi:glycosyltransferase involved in cell wall biosynthesis
VGFDAHVLDGRFQGSRTVISNTVMSLAKSSDDITVYAYSSRLHFDAERVLTHTISRNPVLRLIFDLAFAPRKHDLHAMVYQYICAPWAQRSWVTIHDILPITHPHLFNIKFTIRCAALFISSMLWARKVITVSNYTFDAVARLLPWISSKLVVVRNGPSFREDTYFTEKKEGERTPYVMTVGRLERRKNVDLLIAAFARASLTDVNLVVVGKREPGYRIDMTAPNVIQIEDAPDETLIDLYLNASLFVYPSEAEGFGLPLLDAVLFGVPTLSSNQTAMPEVGGDLAEYFDPTARGAVENLATRIRGHFTGFPVSRPSLEARLRHADAFSWRRSAATLTDALRRDAAQ